MRMNGSCFYEFFFSLVVGLFFNRFDEVRLMVLIILYSDAWRWDFREDVSVVFF